MMIPPRPLRLLAPGEIRQIFEEPREIPSLLRDFMTTIAPTIKEDSITALIAVELTRAGAMRNDRRIEFLDDIMLKVNFPRSVAREIDRIVDQVQIPQEYVQAAERIVPPLENLAGALLETGPPFPTLKFTKPMSTIQRLAYNEALESFNARRVEFVHHLSCAVLCYALTPSSFRPDYLRKVTYRLSHALRYLDAAGGICGFTLHHESTWKDRKPTRGDLMVSFNEAKARDAVAQEMLDEELPMSPARRIMTTVDDLFIEYCQRATRSRSRDMRPLAFWYGVQGNTPFVVD